MVFFEVRCGAIFRLFISFFPAFFLRLLLERCALSEYRLLLIAFESRLGFLLDRVVICSLAFFLEACAERGLKDDVCDVVDLLFLLGTSLNSQQAPKLATALQLKSVPCKTDLRALSEFPIS
jgi:hypothetical protein